MVHAFVRTAVALTLAAGVLLPTWAASSAASSASDSLSTSVGSLSDSIQGSSNSISGDRKVAAGDYRIIDVATVAERPGQLRVTLQAGVAGTAAEPVLLYLPQATADAARLAVGQTVAVSERAYGLAFARADAPAQPFFLVLEDAWFRQLGSHPVTL
ncbi:MAG: hypothetical protein RLY78_1039 [Pseudomonadota bacterium]